uniref:Uncharacterized protein n=1 Tax=Panagrolaimus superbus TaxID=310955 RepID=A0A914XX65_9BILA
MQAMSIIPKSHWKLQNSENGIGVDTKLFIFTHPSKNLGREYSFGVTFEGGVLFYCDNCLFLTRERQKRKAFYKIVKGKVVIREANHYATCRPYECRHAFYAEDDNNNDDAALDGGDDDGNVSAENEGDYDSQEPETTMEYDSTPAASTPDIPESDVGQQEVPKITPKGRSRTIRKDPIIKPSPATASTTRKSSSTRSTFVPIFSSATPPQPVFQSKPPQKRTSFVATPATVPTIFYPSTPSSSSSQQPSTTSTVSTPIQKPINLLQRPLPLIPAKFKPYILPFHRTIIYNTPSSGQMRDIATKFGFHFSYKCFQFWSSTLSSISEITGASKPTQIYETASFDDFSSLSIFLTGVEEYGQQIQEGIKEYFCKTYFTGMNFLYITKVA